MGRAKRWGALVAVAWCLFGPGASVALAAAGEGAAALLERARKAYDRKAYDEAGELAEP